MNTLKTILEFPKYRVTKIGRVWSSKRKGKWLKPHHDGYGYLIVSLMKENKRYCKKIHRLVAQTYIPNPDYKPEINHINGIKTDNRVENLEWVTHKENIQHSYDNGFRLKRSYKITR